MLGSHRRWRDLTPTQRIGLVLLGTVQLILLVAALTDLRRRPATQIKGGKPLWAALVFVNVGGPLAYFAFARKR